MKTLFLVLIFSSISFASELRYLNSRGSATGFCSGGNSFCLSDIKNRAEYEGQREIDFQCRNLRGSLITTYCSTYCSPSYIPINAPSTFVRCDTTCNAQCQF